MSLLEAANVPLEDLLDDLVAEQASLWELVAAAADDVLATASSAAGWDVGDQLAHLVHGDRLATLAATDHEGFLAELQRLLAGDIEAGVAAEMAPLRALPRDALVAAWRDASDRLVASLRGRRAEDKLSWVAGPMSVATFVRARLMEAFAHGQDVRDGLGVPPPTTDRVRHVAYLGVRTRDFSYLIRGMQAPAAPVHVVLAGAGGQSWTWGPADAADRIEGDAVDFALVVTRRRHPDDTALAVSGEAASSWMDVAQCYAGPPGPHRPAGTFPAGVAGTVAT